MARIGVLVNPDAGLGGKLGFKGSDGRAEEARSSGAKDRAGPRANRRAGGRVALDLLETENIRVGTRDHTSNALHVVDAVHSDAAMHVVCHQPQRSPHRLLFKHIHGRLSLGGRGVRWGRATCPRSPRSCNLSHVVARAGHVCGSEAGQVGQIRVECGVVLPFWTARFVCSTSTIFSGVFRSWPETMMRTIALLLSLLGHTHAHAAPSLHRPFVAKPAATALSTNRGPQLRLPPLSTTLAYTGLATTLAGASIATNAALGASAAAIVAGSMAVPEVFA